MAYAPEQKAQLAEFLRDVKTYKQIIADIADIKKFEEAQQNFLKNFAAPRTLQDESEQIIQQFRLKYKIQQLEQKIKQFVGQNIKESAPLLMQLNNLNNEAGYDATVAGKLKQSLLDLLKERSAPHQDYIANRFAQGQQKVQKVLNTMPDERDAARANRFVTFSLVIRLFVPVGALITGLVPGLVMLAVTSLVPAIPVLTLAAIVATTALVCILGLVCAPWLVSTLAAKKAIPIQDNYNASLVKAQKTLKRAIEFEDTYTFLVQEGISIMPAGITSNPSVEQANDPLLTNQQGSVFSIKATLENGDMPELNKVPYTVCII